jgi:hypothetical protein
MTTNFLTDTDGETTAAPAQAPAPLWKGNVAIYERLDGTAVVAFRQEGDEEDGHHVIPAAIWSLIASALRGEPVNLSPVQIARLLVSRH